MEVMSLVVLLAIKAVALKPAGFCSVLFACKVFFGGGGGRGLPAMIPAMIFQFF